MAKSLTLFRAFDPAASATTEWATDGTAAGTISLKAKLSSGAPDAAPLGDGRGLFIGTVGNVLGLVVTDGTVAGTSVLSTLNVAADPNAQYRGYSFNTLSPGRTVFEVTQVTQPYISQIQLWTTDGTVAGTTLLKTINPAQASNVNGTLIPVGNGRSLFQVQSSSGAVALWSTDGTAAGTVALPGGSVPVSSVFVKVGSRVVYTTGDYGLYATDGTVAGTVALRAGGTSFGGGLKLLPNGLALTSSSAFGTGAVTYYTTDGTVAGTAVAASTIDTSLLNANLTALGNGLALFVRKDAVNGEELWVTDGTTASTKLLKDIYPGANSSFSSGFTVIGANRAVFSAQTSDAGFEPWVTDGTAAGTMLLKDLLPGVDSSLASSFVAIGNNQALFEASTATNRRDGQLYVTDGTAAGTALVKTVYDGTNGAQVLPQGFVNIVLGPTVVPYAYSIAALDATKADSLTGTTDYTFTITRTGDATKAAAVAYTAGGSGVAPVPANMFATTVGTVSFAAGVTTAVATIVMKGVPVLTAETFTVGIFGAPAGLETSTTAQGTVLGNTALQAVVTGTAGQGAFVDTSGSQLYIGANGQTAVRLAEGFRGDTFLLLANGDVQVTHGGQVDYLRGITELRFIDGRLVFDAGDAAAAVSRMYQAALGRLPDQGGLNYWIAALQRGVPLADLATGFLTSSEFLARFGSGLANGDFVSRIYLNVLGRAADAGGLAYWTGLLNAATSTRGQVLAGISDSSENKIVTAPLLASGIWDVSETAAQVARLYDTALGRPPDAGGLAYWRDAIDSGSKTLADLATSFVTSNEFQQTYGALGNRAFVEKVYNNSRAGA